MFGNRFIVQVPACILYNLVYSLWLFGNRFIVQPSQSFRHNFTCKHFLIHPAKFRTRRFLLNEEKFARLDKVKIRRAEFVVTTRRLSVVFECQRNIRAELMVEKLWRLTSSLPPLVPPRHHTDLVQGDSGPEQVTNCTVTPYYNEKTRVIGFISEWIHTYNFLSSKSVEFVATKKPYQELDIRM
ncbi:hypothetical protein J6590_085885 [Homalodisca vitripennis]|nr:hypothetical protein J6590_085885 [Homalodisca vitripennis]